MVQLRVVGLLAADGEAASKVMSNWLRAGFQRIVQRRRPCPVGVGLMIAK